MLPFASAVSIARVNAPFPYNMGGSTSGWVRPRRRTRSCHRQIPVTEASRFPYLFRVGVLHGRKVRVRLHLLCHRDKWLEPKRSKGPLAEPPSNTCTSGRRDEPLTAL